MPIRSIEWIVSDARDDVAAYYEQKESPAPESDEIVSALIDCKGVVIGKETGTSEDMAKDPKKPGKKKQTRARCIEYCKPGTGKRVRKRLEGYSFKEAQDLHDELRAAAKKRARSGRKTTDYRTREQVRDNYVAHLETNSSVNTAMDVKGCLNRFIEFINAMDTNVAPGEITSDNIEDW
ncbi:hypothetical protein ACFL2Q_15810 [Thermodesulfobacteriota bacterium]